MVTSIFGLLFAPVGTDWTCVTMAEINYNTTHLDLTENKETVNNAAYS